MSLLRSGPQDTTTPIVPVQRGSQPPLPQPREPAEAEQPRLRAGRELLLVTVLFLVYKFGRMAATGHVATAFDNANDVWRLERDMWLPNELSLQNLFFCHMCLVRGANIYYAAVHFPATAAFLLWTYRFRPAHYLWARRALAGITAAALAMHLLTPLAPPRMLQITGMIDTARRYGPAVYGSPKTDTLSNQYAAMPSLHVGWALMVAIGLIAATRSRWRWLWLAHPVVTVAVVVATANHYWLDAIVAVLLLMVALIILDTPAKAAQKARSRREACYSATARSSPDRPHQVPVSSPSPPT